jgi:hypothetical protein
MVHQSSVISLYQEAERLDNSTLDTFIANILALRKRRDLTENQQKEAILLKKINKSLSIEQIERFRLLNEKRIGELLTDFEYNELLVLVEKIEKLNVTRLKYLTELAQLRGISVRELMAQLGISNPHYA